ncbi:CD276 antigen homolog [Amblyraja radiata]|uniref:CD276 antigen homolog n=1 Tax=Amblyraja radiata TaxID=386614 RepID=UPI0014023B9D|nr:CD276 antigen homolog [Amblyraja radiata]
METFFTQVTDILLKRYTLYRPSTGHSELHLVCYSNGRNYSRAEWFWSPHHLQQWKSIASAERSQPIIINVNGSNFVNRLVTSGKLFDGKDFNVRIVPVVFQDAGVYTCYLEQNLFRTIDLITVKVTAEPSDAVTEGDNVTLTCSVSNVIGSMRLVWINGDGKRVGEKTLTVEEKSPSLVIQKAERGRGNWKCVLFDQHLPRLFVPYYQKDSRSLDISSFTDIRIIIVLGYLVIKLAVALGLICCSWRMNRSCRNPREVTGNVTNNSNEAVAMQTLNSDPDLRDQNE